MTNEQLTDRVVELEKYKAKAEIEHDGFRATLEKIQSSLDVFNKLATDFNIMANNLTNMQKTQEAISKKVDGILQKDYKEFEENKKRVTGKIIDGIVGGLIAIAGGAIVFFVNMYFKG